jgi:RNase P/RNase MRP subunit POP5
MCELQAFIEAGTLKTKTGTEGAARGVVYVSRQQCSQLREKIGFTEDEAAKRLGITVERFRYLLDGVDWRQSEKIPLVTVQAVRKRMESRHGYTIEEAASELGKTVQWVNEQIEAGVIRVSRAKWDRRRKYISEPMMKRLRKGSEETAEKPEALGKDWLCLSDAAQEAGICTTTLIRWATHEGMVRREVNGRWRYHREAVRAHARRYWKSVRFHRATPPAWLE